MCQRIGEKLAAGMIYLQDTNCKIEDGKLIWSKVPKWFYFGAATSALVIGGGVLTILGIWHSSSPYVTGSFFTLCGVGSFVTTVVFTVKRYQRFRAYEKSVREKLVNMQDYLGLKPRDFQNINTKIGECELPREIIQLIFSYLTTKDLVNASGVCKNWNMQSKVDGMWEALGKKKFKNWEKLKLEKSTYSPKQVYVYFSKIQTIAKSIQDETKSILDFDRLTPAPSFTKIKQQ